MWRGDKDLGMRLTTLILTLLLGCLFVVGDSTGAALVASDGPPIPPADADSDHSAKHRALLNQAFQAAGRKRWPRAHQLAAKVDEPLVWKILRWRQYSEDDASADFATLTRFIDANPTWPRQQAIRRRVEKAMDDGLGDAATVAWFTKHPPISSPGRRRLAEVLMRQGQTKEAARWIRYVWITDDLTHKESRSFYNRNKRHLGPAEHKARLDRLLWAGKRAQARRMLSLMPRGQRYLAEARIALMVRSIDVGARIAIIAAGITQDKHEGARTLLAWLPGDPGPRPEKWWVERRIQARKLLALGKSRDAYGLASGHGQESGTAAYAEAEWLAGWIALRFLDDKEAAQTHFRQLYEAVKYPVSRARGAYWRARVSDAMRRPSNAVRWYRIAAGFPTTFYGQLAAERLDAKANLRLLGSPPPRPEQWAGFKRRETVKAAKLLGELEQWKLFRSFILDLALRAKQPVERMMIAGLATRFERYELAVRVAKVAKRSKQRIVEYGYPIFQLPRSEIESGLVFAVMRQESEFSVSVISRAGAQGLMQLMPATARQMARALRILYSRSRLLTDPNYNARLGTAYISKMLRRFDGSYPLAVAAYNAGPGRVAEWLGTYGDPRDPSVDAIDWVESIPFSETRNYVQRVLEGLQVYRLRLAERPLASRLTADLARNTKAP